MRYLPARVLSNIRSAREPILPPFRNSSVGQEPTLTGNQTNHDCQLSEMEERFKTQHILLLIKGTPATKKVSSQWLLTAGVRVADRATVTSAALVRIIGSLLTAQQGGQRREKMMQCQKSSRKADRTQRHKHSISWNL